MSAPTDHQMRLLDLLMKREALRFGDFTLKSGRKSPYFVNLGQLHHGSDLDLLGEVYARQIAASFGDEVDLIFGPAYKGIPLACATAAALERHSGRAIGWTFDRKEAKTHGDGGGFVGAPLQGGARVVLVDDVMTAGTAIRQGLAKLAELDVQVRGCLIAVDREERGRGDQPARAEIAAENGIEVAAILTISQVVDALEGTTLSPDQASNVRAHVAGARGA